MVRGHLMQALFLKSTYQLLTGRKMLAISLKYLINAVSKYSVSLMATYTYKQEAHYVK